MTRFSKLVSILVVSGFSLCSMAQSLGTKADVSAKSNIAEQPLVQPMDILQMVMALVIVGALLKWVLPKAIAKLGKRITNPIGSTIHIEESASFGGGQLQIVTVRGKTLLLCVTAQGVTNLADLTLSTDEGVSQQPAFIDFLDNATGEPDQVIVAESVETEESMSVAEAIQLIENAKSGNKQPSPDVSPLDRLNRLTQGR